MCAHVSDPYLLLRMTPPPWGVVVKISEHFPQTLKHHYLILAPDHQTYL